MKAMIFAAGLGTRLGDLTRNTPKALVKVSNWTLLDLIIKKMIAFGIRDIIINVHHFANQMEDYIRTYSSDKVNLFISDERNQLLDTGGALKHALDVFEEDENILIHNVDIISNLDFNDFEQTFLSNSANVLLAVKNRDSSRKLLFDKKNKLIGWKNLLNNEQILVQGKTNCENQYSFSGISMMKASVPASFSDSGAFPLILALLKIAEHQKIIAYTENHKWIDTGKAESIIEAEKHISEYYKKWLR